MNHLCHIFLSQGDPELLIGNFIGDMILPSEKKHLPPGIQKGIELHYFIDKTVDQHPVYRSGMSILRASQKKYAPVVIDIFCDFLLVDQWSAFSAMEYEAYKHKIYGTIIASNPFVSEHRLYPRIVNMIKNDFLAAYVHSDRIPHVFSFLQRRAKFENNFNQAQQDYLEHYAELKEKFLTVFPEMVIATHQYIRDGIIPQN
jgi:acyl carrier protein phosphodiesterase